MNEKTWKVYLLRCSDNSLYCGISKYLENRLIEHNTGKGAKYTRSRRPVELLGASLVMTKGEALKLEYRIKQLPAHKKMAELTKIKKQNGNLENEMRSLQRKIKAIRKKIDKLIAAVER